MFHRIPARVLGVVLLLLTFGSVWMLSSAQAAPAPVSPAWGEFTASRGQMRPASDLVDVHFSQLNWLADNGTVKFQNSRVAVAEFSFAPNARKLLDKNGGGFLNVIIDVGNGSGPQWSVQNLYLTYRNKGELTHAHPTVEFGLPINSGNPVPNLVYQVSLTKQPLAQYAAPPTLPANVEAEDYLVGGLDNGGSGGSNFPMNIGPWSGCPILADCNPSPIAMGRINISIDQLPVVREDPMGCAPAAAARSIKYLLGDAVGDVQGIYDGLKGTMGTNPTTGTTEENILKGKRKYTKQNKLKIDSRFAGWSKSAAKAAMASLNGGADIEAILKFDNQPIGHVAMITSITQIDKDHWQVKYVDDPNQKDGTPENKEHVITVDRDGNFPGGKIDKMLIETKK